ncbi:MAG: amidohydrolase family protein [Chloroflexota bacterium]
MRDGFIVIDADGHAGDLEPMYRQRLPEQYRKRMSVGGSGDTFDRRQNGTIPFRSTSLEQNLADNDLQGIDVQVLYPTGGLGLSRIREHDYSIAFARTYNDWLSEYCAENPKRIKGVAIVPIHVDVQESIRELERAVEKLGLVGVMLNSFIRDRNVAHPDFWPFYEACDRLGVAIGFHSSGGDAMDPVAHFDNLLAMHTFSHAPEQLLCCTAVIYSGLLEKFQNIRVAFLEAGAGWVPFWMERMDGEWARRKFDAPLLQDYPSAYMKCGRVYVSCEPEEKTLSYVAEWIGADQLLFPSDYPHWDGAFPNSVEELSERDDVSEELKRKIFFDNPQRLYELTVDPADFQVPVKVGLA